jgi:hypothetical protein
LLILAIPLIAVILCFAIVVGPFQLVATPIFKMFASDQETRVRARTRARLFALSMVFIFSGLAGFESQNAPPNWPRLYRYEPIQAQVVDVEEFTPLQPPMSLVMAGYAKVRYSFVVGGVCCEGSGYARVPRNVFDLNASTIKVWFRPADPRRNHSDYQPWSKDRVTSAIVNPLLVLVSLYALATLPLRTNRQVDSIARDWKEGRTEPSDSSCLGYSPDE